MFYSMVRAPLFRLDAETAHELTLGLLQHSPSRLGGWLAGDTVHDPVSLFGLRFRNRCLLAAGLDKNALCLHSWQAMGFGGIEVGTVTPRPQPGNPRPRMFRLPEQQAVINRLGFNNQGVDAAVARVREHRATATAAVIGINIGKNADTPIERAVDDYRLGLQRVHACADYVTVNISSPNTRNLRDLQDEQRLQGLLDELADERARLADCHGRRVPILVKLSPDMSEDPLRRAADCIRDAGMDGIIATNTTLARDGLPERWASEAGGLSGAPLRERAVATLRALRTHLGREFPLIGVGGIMQAADAVERIEAGADLIQLYSGMIYRGPQLVRETAAAMAAMPKR